MSASRIRRIERAVALAVLPVALMGLSVPAVNASAPKLFAAKVDYATGGTGGPGWEETSTAVADFTSDGHPDVIVAEYFNQSASGPILMRNKGDGTFATPGTKISVPGGRGIGTVLAGDFNNDGAADLLLTSDITVLTVLGKGDGTFRVSGQWTLPQQFQGSSVIADLNGDGAADLVVKSAAGLQTYLGKGDGSFKLGPFTTIQGSLAPTISGIVKARFNNDAYPDLAATDAGTQRVFALAGDGKGGFTTLGTGTTLGALSVVPGTALAGDLNGDGIDDVVALNEFSVPGTAMAVLIANGKGGFKAPKFYEGGFNPATGAIGDLNKDGHLDVVSSDTTGARQVVQLGDGKGGFTTGGSYAVATAPQTPVIADLNGDGKPDIAVGGVNGAGGATQLSVLRNLS